MFKTTFNAVFTDSAIVLSIFMLILAVIHFCDTCRCVTTLSGGISVQVFYC